MIASPLELAHRQRRFWHFLRMRWAGRSDIVYRNYDLLHHWNGAVEADFKWAGFRGVGEQIKPAMRRLQHNIYLKYEKRPTDIALMTLMREYVVWQRIHDGDVRDWPTRHADEIKRLHLENEAAKAHPQPKL